ncbi:hypothetical protein jaqu_19640 [Jannaschia aquimarina]|uniref:Uncharacterized protein n=1 Tax=Jannaschia aquimarina TaxID=935700 RepID=A0A0D1D8G7_9RHOB|nr:hypothetical protein [Jannaschia aquimarina]KIT16213.1 hypothetical protein jaqu_19640 [Jannaschia aquimarina]
MKTLTLIAAAALSLGTLPAAAQQLSPMERAIAHFNQDLSGNDVIPMPDADRSLTSVSTRGGTVGEAIAHFNQDRTGNDRLRAETATAWSGQPTYGAEIFERLRAEDDD